MQAAIDYLKQSVEFRQAMDAAGIKNPADLKPLADLRSALSKVFPPSANGLALPQFEKFGDDVVIDHSTGLMWDARKPSKASNWKEAIEIASKVDLHGYSDWHLPSRRELLTLVDDSRSSPAINTDFFPNTPTNDWYWTSTAYAASPSDFAWLVDFLNGYVGYYYQGGSGFVRACRRFSPGQ